MTRAPHADIATAPRLRQTPPPLPVPPWIHDVAPSITTDELPGAADAERPADHHPDTPLALRTDVSATEAALLRAELWRELRDIQRGPDV